MQIAASANEQIGPAAAIKTSCEGFGGIRVMAAHPPSNCNVMSRTCPPNAIATTLCANSCNTIETNNATAKKSPTSTCGNVVNNTYAANTSTDKSARTGMPITSNSVHLVRISPLSIPNPPPPSQNGEW